jgi:hypothetical protein
LAFPRWNRSVLMVRSNLSSWIADSVSSAVGARHRVSQLMQAKEMEEEEEEEEEEERGGEEGNRDRTREEISMLPSNPSLHIRIDDARS